METGMNIEALKRTRDAIEAAPESYSQDMWMHDCGTPACVAGFACVAHGYEIWVNEAGDDSAWKKGETGGTVPSVAAALLEMTSGEAREMFNGTPMGFRPSYLDAINMLDHAIADGVVEWYLEKL